MDIQERDDVLHVVMMAPFEGDAGYGALIGHDGVTAIKIVKRHGPMDWLPYVEVWQGNHLHAEAAQHQCAWIEFKPALSQSPSLNCERVSGEGLG